jgi:hypothetical protein
MDEDTRAAIAKVTAVSPNGAVRGTGFLVAPDLVATALHNVADRKQTPLKPFEQIKLEFPGYVGTATLVEYDRDADCAILRCEQPPPPTKYKPLALQALERSGGEWETWGFPNLQRLDGLTVNGDVTNHLGELEGQSVIQLYSKQLAAGIGGDARGLSGSPVLMRNVVVGLMRFALGAEDRTAGGVVYACPARFLAALNKEKSLKIQAMPKVTTLLNPAQMSALIPLYVAEFGEQHDTLEYIIWYALGADLEDIIHPDSPFPEIVSSLVAWANGQGSGPIEALLRATLGALPNSRVLRGFFQAQNLSAVMQPINVGTQIFNATMTLNTLSVLAKLRPDVQAIAGMYTEDFATILQQLRVIELYKGLHNILHKLQFKLEAIELALSSPASDAKANEKLERYAGEIVDLAQDAEGKIDALKGQVDGLNPAETERGWIDWLRARAAEMKEVAQPSASEEERGQVYTSLRSQVNQAAPQINRALAEAAGRLRFVNLVDMIDAVISRATPTDPEIRTMINGASAVGALRISVAGLIKEHFSWQRVSSDLEGAKSSIRHQPQGKVFEWPAFEQRVRGLCAISPTAVWAIRLLGYLDSWAKATPNSKPEADEKKAGQIAFLTFSGACNDRFYDVDDAVKDMSEKIVQLADPLRDLLAAARPPIAGQTP